MPQRGHYKRSRTIVVHVPLERGGLERHELNLTGDPGPYTGHLLMPTAVLYDDSRFPGTTRVPKAVWFDRSMNREAARLYGVLRHLSTFGVNKDDNRDEVELPSSLIEGLLDTPWTTIKDWLKDLERSGHITRLGRTHHHMPERYRLNSG